MSARHDTLLPGLAERARDRSRLLDGFRWQFAPDAHILVDIATVIEAERQCCRFLQFRVTVEADDGPVWMDVTGPDGTADFLALLVPE